MKNKKRFIIKNKGRFLTVLIIGIGISFLTGVNVGRKISKNLEESSIVEKKEIESIAEPVLDDNQEEKKEQDKEGREDKEVDSDNKQQKNIEDYEKVAFLTFDDGPTRNTDTILDILAEYDVQGTFFVLGSSIQNQSNSELVLNRMIDENHYIGLHSMTHDIKRLYQGQGAAQNFLKEMIEVQDLVKEITDGFESHLFRAPYGTYGTFSSQHTQLMVNSDLKGWDWNIDSNDWRATSTSQIMKNIKHGIEGSNNPNQLVVLFHEKDITVEALPSVIEYLLEQGYELLPYDPSYHFPMNLINDPNL